MSAKPSVDIFESTESSESSKNEETLFLENTILRKELKAANRLLERYIGYCPNCNHDYRSIHMKCKDCFSDLKLVIDSTPVIRNESP